jgi:hypothetical protein
MKTAILILHVDSRAEKRNVSLPPGQQFHAALRKIVTEIVGEPMEHVKVFTDFNGGPNYRYLDMFVNELGHMKDPPLPRNQAATFIYRRNWMSHANKPGNPEDLPWIAGPAVLFRDPVWR